MKKSTFTRTDFHGDTEGLIAESYEIFERIISVKQSPTWKSQANLKMSVLVKKVKRQYSLETNDLLHELFKVYLETEAYRTYDPKKGKLYTFIYTIVFNKLRNMARHYKSALKDLEFHSWDKFSSGSIADEDSRSDNYISYWEKKGVKGLSTIVTPEDILIGKELEGMIMGHFGEWHSDVVLGRKDRATVSGELDIEYFSFCKQIQRKTFSFATTLSGTGHLC